MMNWFKNNKGFTTTELLIAVFIASVLGLGGAFLLSNLEKNKYAMATSTDYLGLEKTIEGFMHSPRGCESLRNLPIGSEDVAFYLGTGENKGPRYARGQKFGKITIDGLKLLNFASVDPDSSFGIAQVELKMLKDGAASGVRRIFPVAVSVENQIVMNCQSHTAAFNDLLNQACYQTYGRADTMDCQQVKDLLINYTIERICEDVYGPQEALYQVNTTVGGGRLKFCDLKKVHAKGTFDCGVKYLQGINADGTPNCVPGNVPTVPVTGCTAWSAWTPDASTVCSPQNFPQSRTCTAGSTGTESQTGTGTKAVTYSWNPGPPENYCPSQSVTRTNDCNGIQNQVYGTSTAASCTACTTTWSPAANASDICTGDSVTQTDSCDGSNTRVVNGTKTCTSTNTVCEIGTPFQWGTGGFNGKEPCEAQAQGRVQIAPGNTHTFPAANGNSESTFTCLDPNAGGDGYGTWDYGPNTCCQNCINGM